MSPHAAQWQEALRALEFMLGWRGGWMPLRFERPGRSALFWHHCGVPGSGRILERLVHDCDLQHSDQVELLLPEPKRFNGGPCGASALWCRIEGRDQLDRARRFRPLPSVVLQEGTSSRRLLLWGLREWLNYFNVEKANRRIAYRLRATQKHGVPENLRVPAPGTFLRAGRARPTPVVVRRCEPVLFGVDQVAGRLKDPPPQRMPWEAAA